MTQDDRHEHSFLSGNGPVAQRLRAHDWSTSELGPPSQWSPQMRAAVDEVLGVLCSGIEDDFMGHEALLSLAEESSRAWEARFRAMADIAPAMLWIADNHTRTTFLSRGWYDFTGQTEAHALGMGWAQAVHPDDRDGAIAQYFEAVERHEPFTLDMRVRRHDGEYRWVLDSGRPRFDEDGQWLGYIGSVIDVDQRKKTEQALRQANQRKTHFMALLSHELRNPLAPIRLSLDLLDEVDPDAPAALQARAIIERQVDQLAELVDDLLDVTRVASGKIELERERVDLGQLLYDTVEDHRPLFVAKDVGLELAPIDETLVVDVDYSRMRQVVGNLLQNAAKFTKPGGAATVRATAVEGGSDGARQAEIRVTDTGLGMTPQTLASLFEPFVQADTSLEHAGGGLGLGLALVKGLVEQHGGQVSVTSAGLGHGAEFVVRLPLAEHAEHAASEVSAEVDGTARRVLIIDDNADLAEALATMLEMRGHRVIVAEDGRQGIEKARAFAPEVVFCDIGLPGLDGYEVARALRRIPELRSTVLVALSGYAADEDIDESHEAGFDLHIAKPPRLPALEAAIATAPRA